MKRCKLIWFFILFCLIRKGTLMSNTLYGYDCSGAGMKTRAVSLLSVDECNFPDDRAHIVREEVQLFQMTATTHVTVKNCQIFKSFSIIRCGMHSHQMLLAGPFYNVPNHPTIDTCQLMMTSGFWEPEPGHRITSLRPNVTTQATFTEQGSLEKDGTCSGMTITVDGVTYPHAFIQSSYAVTIREYSAIVNSKTNTIFLQDGESCPHDQGWCRDNIGGTSVWTPYQSSCNKFIPSLLYDGQAEISVLNDVSVIRVHNNGMFFVSQLKPTTHICGRIMHGTDYQDLVVLRSSVNNPKFMISHPDLRQVDPLLYSNSKISYLQYRTIDNLNNIHKDILFKLCNLERQVLYATLNILRLSSGQPINLLGLGGRGTIVKVRGEVAYLTSCPIMTVFLRQETTCYQGIPVTYNGTNQFLLPISRIIVPTVPEEECSSVAPHLIQIGQQWISFHPQIVPTQAPTVLRPQTHVPEPIQPIQGFAEGGLYSKAELDKFRDSMVYPSSREAVLTDFSTSIVTGQAMKYDIMASLSQASWDMVLRRHLQHAWGWFMIFGEVFSGFLGFYCIYLLISRCIGIIVRGLALRQIGGCSWRILASICSSTTLLATLCASRQPRSSAAEVINNADDQVDDAPVQRESNSEVLPLNPMYPQIIAH